MLSPAEEHVNAVLGTQKANLALFIATNQGDHYHFCLLALEIVDCGKAERLKQYLFLKCLATI